MAKLYNLARVYTATTGTGTVTLGAPVPGFLTFANAGVSDGDVVSYGIFDGVNSETGTGTYTASGTTLTRSVTTSTNGNAAINLSGSAQVFITARAQDIGSVTSVALTAPSIFGVAGSPITTSGTITQTLATQLPNLVWASSGTGATVAPVFRSLVTADLPGGVGTVSSVALSLPGIFSVSGSPVTTSGTLTGSLATQLPSLIWASSSSGATTTPTFRALVSGDLPAGTGTVTSVALTAPNIFTVGGSPLTTSGTITQSLATQLPSLVFASSSSGATTTPSFRALVSGDIPALSYVTNVGLSLPNIFTLSGTPVTSAGTLTGSLATQLPNLVWASSGTGATVTPTFRALVSADLPAATGTVTSIATGNGITGGTITSTGTLNALGLAPSGLRLTLVTATPVMTSTQSAKTTVYLTPYIGTYLPSYNGTSTVMVSTGGEVSIALDSNSGHTGYQQSGKNFDLFWDDAGARLVTGPAWTSDTARATALEYKNGFLCNAASMTAKFDASSSTATIAQDRGLYLGTMRASADGQTQYIFGASASGGTAASFLLWNMYNRVTTGTMINDTTASWTYATAAYRAANNSSGNRISYVCGQAEDAVCVTYTVASSNAATTAYVGVGVDTTTGNNGILGQQNINISIIDITSFYSGYPGLGFHYCSAVELASGATVTYYGGSFQMYLKGELRT